MDLVAKAVGSIIFKLGELLEAEYKRQKGLPKQIESLKNELEHAQAALLTVGQVPPEQLNPQVRLWARELREAAYDMDDILDTVLVEQAASAETESKNGLRNRLKKKMTKLFKKSKARHDIASAIEDMKKRLEEVSARRDRYSTTPIAPPAPSTKVDPRLVDMHKEAAQIIGIERTRAELVAMLQSSTHGHGDAGSASGGSSNQTKIVCVVGAGGLGKTTLAKVVYDELSPRYDCRAFVSVGRNPNLVQVFTSIFFHLGQEKYLAISDLPLLIGELRKFLENKRYFIVIDDVWDIKSWEPIRSALDQKNSGSRVIKTTRNLEVACSDEVYHLSRLTPGNSKKLFYMRLFGGEDKCPANHPEEASKKIQDKCGGVPLAIITMASLLVGKSRQDWFDLSSSPRFYRGRDNKQVDDTVWILSLSYYDLPSHLKSCLLYLSMYPEDSKIEKDSLIWKWVAEGFIEKKTGTSLFQWGEEYFYQLINRSMLEGVAAKWEGIIHSCRVHDMVLDLIRDLASKENFITISDNNDGGTSSQHKVRRIAHQNRILSDQFHTNNHRDMTQLRSLVAHRCDICGSVMPWSFRLLRVLALEGCKPSKKDKYEGHWLEDLGKLVHLRYLGLQWTKVRELPEAIGSLKLLQTLDLRGANLGQLPSSVNLLTWLVCLRCDYWVSVPDGFLQKVTSLEELQIGVRMPEESQRQFLKELGNLSQLRVLCVDNSSGGLDDRMQANFLKSLGNLQELRHLELLFFGGFPASMEWDKAKLPEHLRHLNTGGIEFPCMPSFINRTLLPNLCYLKLRVGHMDAAALRALGGLPYLRYLDILPVAYGMASDKAATVVNIGGHDVFFPELRGLRLEYWMVQLAVNHDSASASISIWRKGQDAAMVFDSKGKGGGRSSRVAPAPVVMPKLHTFGFSVPVQSLYKVGHGTCDNLGLDLECLPSLYIVQANLDCEDAFPEDVSKAEAELRRVEQFHPNSPALSLHVYKDNEDKMAQPLHKDDEESSEIQQLAS